MVEFLENNRPVSLQHTVVKRFFLSLGWMAKTNTEKFSRLHICTVASIVLQPHMNMHTHVCACNSEGMKAMVHIIRNLEANIRAWWLCTAPNTYAIY